MKTATATLTVTPIPPGKLKFNASTFTAREDAGRIFITVDRVDGNKGSVTVDYRTSDGTATNGSDYNSSSGTLTFADGESSRAFPIDIVRDATAGNNETVNLIISNPTGGATLDSQIMAVLTILDINGANPPTISVNDLTVNELNSGTSNASFVVNLSAASTQPIMVAFSSADGTASAGSDYTAVQGTLTFSPGTTLQVINVPIIGDTVSEPNETFTINLNNPANATIAKAQGTCTINNDDTAQATPGTLQFSASSYNVAEGGSIDIMVTRTGGTGGAVSVNYSISNGSATSGSDYTATNGTVSFANGDSASKVFTIRTVDDTQVEGNETVILTLSGASGGATLGLGSATLTISDNDSAQVGDFQFNAGAYTVNENDGFINVTITRSNGNVPASVFF